MESRQRVRLRRLASQRLGLRSLGSFGSFGLGPLAQKRRVVLWPRTEMCGAIFFDKIKTVVGEYAGDHGFSLPNPVSIRPEYSRSRFRIVWRMQTLQKMKILGVEC